MNNNIFGDIPIRSKVQMARDIAEIIECLHHGKRAEAEMIIKDLKNRCALLDETIQQDVLIFVEQVQFQYAYDPWHKVTPDVEAAADRLIEHLGFPPK